jgi:hypothetical protein
MTLARYLLGLGSILVAVTPIVRGSRALRQRYLPELVGPVARLGEVVLSLAIVTVVSETLGTIGLFKLLPIVVTCAGAGLIASRVAGSGDRTGDSMIGEPRNDESAALPNAVGRWGTFAAVATVALVAAEWSMRTADSLRHGMTTADTLWYHLPIAARFAQSGWTSHLYFVDAGSLIVFYPATSELMHGLGIVFFANDMLSPLLNLGWLALALLAGWCIGRPYGLAPLTMMAVALVLATPELVLDDPGAGLNDVVGIALFLAAVALLINATHNPNEDLSPAALACTALASGLALGTKYTLIAPVAALGLGVAVIATRGERARRALLSLAVGALTGGYWYVRNFVAIGNPLPSLRLGIGPFRAPAIPLPGAESVAKYLFDARVWRVYYLPGLRDALGPAWWVLAAAAAAGAITGLAVGPSRVIRMLALVAAASFAAFLFAPQLLGTGIGGGPIYFEANVRYGAIALVLGAALLPIATARHRTGATYFLFVVFGIALAAAQLAPGIWRRARQNTGQPPVDRWSLLVGVIIGIGVFVAATASLALRGRASPSTRSMLRDWRAMMTIIVALCVVGFAVEREYLDHRYTHMTVMPRIYRWARGVHDTRIAIVGFQQVQYPLYGKDSSNFVQYIALRHKDGTSTAITDCATWRRVLNEGRYSYVVTTTPDFPYPSAQVLPPEERWTRSDPAAHLVIHEKKAWLFRIDGLLDPARCRRVS